MQLLQLNQKYINVSESTPFIINSSFFQQDNFIRLEIDFFEGNFSTFYITENIEENIEKMRKFFPKAIIIKDKKTYKGFNFHENIPYYFQPTTNNKKTMVYLGQQFIVFPFKTNKLLNMVNNNSRLIQL